MSHKKVPAAVLAATLTLTTLAPVAHADEKSDPGVCWINSIFDEGLLVAVSAISTGVLTSTESYGRILNQTMDSLNVNQDVKDLVTIVQPHFWAIPSVATITALAAKGAYECSPRNPKGVAVSRDTQVVDTVTVEVEGSGKKKTTTQIRGGANSKKSSVKSDGKTVKSSTKSGASAGQIAGTKVEKSI